MKIIIIISIILSLRIIYNLYNLILCKLYLSQYIKSICGKLNYARFKQQTIDLFKKANIKDGTFPIVFPAGYNHIAKGIGSAFDYIDYHCEYIHSFVANSFSEACGVFRSRIWETINPFFWLEFLIFLKISNHKYLGISEKPLFIKILSIFWWIIMALGTFCSILGYFKIDYIGPMPF